MTSKKAYVKPNLLEIRLNRVAKTIINRALKEDLRDRGDITTRATIPSEQKGTAVIFAREAGVIAGQKIAQGVFSEIEKSVNYLELVPDGEKVDSGTEIARITGKVWAILTGERTALNILGRCSGIASLTNRYVNAVEGTGAKITETRKTAPGLRYLDKASVITGAGVNHRYGLHDAFLIKENHIAAVGGTCEAIEACKRYAAKHGRFRIMVEAEDFEQYKLAVTSLPDRILLDNMTPELIKRCVDTDHGNIELEATGGITLENVREYALAGVDFISIGALTHSVRIFDLSLLIK